ncbi:hypothetical protein AVEN_212461-1 [Araneus ventricosus]|uniref:Uncharacterized protein n=1 Tax=Araneus ventricosus TaxID=182803 RepID=A0A4Y2M5P9_ARAVE|nr:hypothetical protein AVEN_212461-1 [Araneus ventricosus]
MDEFQRSWCSRSFYLKDGHFCFLKGKPDNEYSESDLDELEKLAERLEAATRNKDYISDDFGYLNPNIQGNDTQLNSSHKRDRNFSSNSFFRDEQVTSSPVSPFNTQCHGRRFDVSCSNSHVCAQQNIFEDKEESPVNMLVVPIETSQGYFCRTDNNQSNPSEDFSSRKDSRWYNLGPVPHRKCENTSFEADTSTCRKKENKPSEFIHGGKEELF